MGAGADFARVAFGDFGFFLEERGFEDFELGVEMATPVGWNGGEPVRLLEGEPDVSE